MLLVFLLLLASGANSQETTLWGLMPSVNISKKLPNDWSLQAKVESRLKIYQEDAGLSHLNTDISLLAGRKISLRATVTAGYLARIVADGVSHRLIQQLSYVQRFPGFSLSHRLAFDQTFQKSDKTAYRFRYRFSGEKALQGQSVDPGEYYIKMSNEYLYSVQGVENDLEIRLAGVAGYAISKRTKLELGPEYRLDSFIHSASRQRIWLVINLFQSL